MRNFVLNKVQSDWVLFLDADEHFVADELDKLLNLLNILEDDIGGVSFIRYNFFNTGGWFTDSVLRLFRNHKGFYYENIVSEKIDNSIRSLGYKILDSEIVINHTGFAKTTEFRYEKCRRYIKLYNEQLQITPEVPMLHSLIGIQSKMIGDFETALAESEKAVCLGNEISKTHSIYAEVLRAVSRNKEALEEYEAAYNLATGNARHILKNKIGVMYLSMAEFDEAEKVLEEGYSKYPYLIHQLVNLGITFLYKNRYPEAVQCFEKVLRKNNFFAFYEPIGFLEYDPYKSLSYDTIYGYMGLNNLLAVAERQMR